MALKFYYLDISKTGHNVATAIFQNGFKFQYPRILINMTCRAINVDASVGFTAHRFQIYNHFAPPAFISAIFKDGDRYYKRPHISNTTYHRAILLTLLDSLVDSDITYVICQLQ